MGIRAVRDQSFGVIARLVATIAIISASVLPPPALAWGGYGHRTTGQIALANIKPETRRALEQLLKYEKQLGTPECALKTLEDATVWPDCVRRTRWRWGYTAAWHYRTTPVCDAYEPWKNCSGGNCVTAQIERNQRLLADESLPAHIRLEALAFMVHFVGDIHMPLHSGDKDDRGGNDRKTAYGIVPDMNLHWIWDGALAERAITSTERPMVRRYSAAERADYGGGEPADWGRESWQAARDFVYPNAFNTDPCASDLPDEAALTQEDIVEAIPVAQRRIRQAGLRMAAMLDQAFAPGPLPEPESSR
ncbi:S1/P1 nuclease [Pontixanthobacter aquaemixtae]|uniref:S1/P1 nuclease n=1 Tax=Pontixanthobacter aquaemixtae TaxID=1958940 RepID=UPI002E25843C